MASSKVFTVNEDADSSSWIRIRYIQVVLLFFMLFICFSIRICLSVAIVAMTTNGTSSNPDVPYYNWHNSDIILSSFFWSYAILQFFAGNLAHYFGTKKLLFVTVLTNSLSCALIPVSAQYLGANGVMTLRIIQGLFQGFLLSCLNGVLGRWLPPQELSYINSIVFSGVYLGIVTSMIITGYISASWYGWPAAFYLFGILGVIWCVFWYMFSAETPASHPRISNEERKYIEHSLGQQDDHLSDKISIPWMAIVKSTPYWAIIIAAIGESWTSTFLYVELPSYLSYAVGLNIQDSSLFSAVPTVGALVGALIYGPIGGLALKNGCMSKVNSRRIFQGFSIFSQTIGLLFLSYIENNAAIASVLIAATTASSAVTCGHILNHIDLSPRFAGILSGISNGIGQLIAILAPILVHFIVTDGTDKRLWRYTFIVGAAIGAISAVIFIILCSAERQWWDDVDKKENEVVNEKPLSELGQINVAFREEVAQ
ncbi:vesicular glutamate transporter 2-like isoform X2 [Anthonomus grandis grandis]|uniref:vesicular glutamate transporter 2-like isoform X2 n=1 Tax=Anthonomus grandis grandis TaxID=2921223 RepID=UPI0021667890|nr:vesicular glutamate transporter 2-like isoform X2 [Anthonomus grandis grandis]